VGLVRRAAGAGALTLATDAANIDLSASSMTAGAAAAIKSTYQFSYTVTAQDVTTSTPQNGGFLAGGIPAAAAPSRWVVQVRDSNGVQQVSANVKLSWVEVNNNFFAIKVVETQNGATDFSTNDVIDVIAIA
jgi:hypothetical protein